MGLSKEKAVLMLILVAFFIMLKPIENEILLLAFQVCNGIQILSMQNLGIVALSFLRVYRVG